jgi:mono/diheme cytochrome c family protein
LEGYIGELDDEALAKPLDATSDEPLRKTIGEFLTEICDSWHSAGEKVVTPEENSIPAKDRSPDELKASIDKGRELFFGTRANCFSCHGPTGLGDGQQSDFDDWTKPLKAFVDATDKLPQKIADDRKDLKNQSGEDKDRLQQRINEQFHELEERKQVMAHFLPIRNAIPRDLREGMYRGGGRPIDIYWRISTGIAGTPMPAAPPTITQEELWQIVDFVHSLPFEPASRPLERPINTAEVRQ